MEEAVRNLVSQDFPEEFYPALTKAIENAIWAMSESFYKDGFISEEDIPSTTLMIMVAFKKAFTSNE